MLDPMILKPTLKRPVAKFLPSIRLQPVGLPSSLFQNLVKGMDQRHPGFGFQRLHPSNTVSKYRIPRSYLAKGWTSTKSATH